MFRDYSLAEDLREAAAMANKLTSYMRQDEVFRSTSGGAFYGDKDATLTLGAFMMRLHRLRALSAHMNAEQQARFTTIESAYEMVKSEWSAHYELKLRQEIDARITLMQQLLRECEEQKDSCAENLASLQLSRTILEELLQESPHWSIHTYLADRVRQIDRELASHFAPGEFGPATVLLEVYPQKRYWWLYVTSKTETV
ncbi:MAG: hypothetical protein IT320_23080 [Anaerolineae bacterium]|nr:hypothetical protein [Anaerolineae bacterium]